MMPCAVDDLTIDDLTIGRLIPTIEHEVAVLESETETAGSGEKRSIGAGIGVCLKPEHQRFVLNLRARQQVACQVNRVGGSQMKRDTFLQRPRSAAGIEGGAVSLVGERLSLSFVHRIVREQFALVTREVMVGGIGYLSLRERLGPYTRLQHVSFVPHTEEEGHEGRVREDFGIGPAIIGDIHRTGIETHISRLVIIGDDDAREGRHGRSERLGDERVIKTGMQHESVIRSLTEEQHIISVAVHEEHLIHIAHRLDHKVDRERFVGETAIDLRLGIRERVTGERQRCAGRQTDIIGHAQQLEVIILVQIIAGYRFIETQKQIATDAEDAVSGFGLTEDARWTRILNTGEHRGRTVDKPASIAAEGYGTQVVLLLHRVALAIEMYIIDTPAFNHRFVARSGVIERVVSVIAA